MEQTLIDAPIAPPPPPRPRGFWGRIRAYFLTGVVIAGPVAVTAWLVFWFVDTVDHWIRPLIPTYLWPDEYLPRNVPGVGVLLAFVGLTLLGFLAANLLGRSLIRLSEGILDRMPVVRGIYKSVKQLFETVFSQQGTSFRRVGLVQFPAKGQWSLVFISTPPGERVKQAIGAGAQPYVSVFLPCTPNPTTGFFFYLPVDEVIEIDMSPDEAAKLIMSAGLIQPDELAALAKAGKKKAEVAAAAG
ncbi:MAG: DUF502 domain-containing protein [Hyphomicrobiales bacterium]|nr:DUF502 domain-containing protein [Hyphomicrobiales bacterium]